MSAGKWGSRQISDQCGIFDADVASGGSISRQMRSFIKSGSVDAPSAPDAVMEMHHTVAEAAFIQQFKSQADIVREGRQATSWR